MTVINIHPGTYLLFLLIGWSVWYLVFIKKIFKLKSSKEKVEGVLKE